MNHELPNANFPLTRRQWLARTGTGLPLLGLASVLSDDQLLASDQSSGAKLVTAPRPPHFVPRAKHVIHIFANGGPSHVDTFDPKPALAKYAGKPLSMHLKTERKTGAAFPSSFKFTQHGESGLPISELFEDLAPHADRMCVIRSMHADLPNHEPSLMLMNCGDQRLIRPSMGSWVTYGLGTENQNLPGFVAMCPQGYPIKGVSNWRSAFLPGALQGTYIDPTHKQIDKLIQHIRNTKVSLVEQRRQLDLLEALNRRHLEARQNDAALDARIQSYELAYRMQMAASEAFDVERESKQTLDMYGPGVHARQCLMARRLVERGVRYVQLWHGKNQPWDNHDQLEKNHARLAKQCSQAIGALLTDLTQRGLLDDTLVIWGGEFGRTPTVELPSPGRAKSATGRDHNHHGFSMWLAGGGVRGGYVHGATDEFGFRAVENRVHVHDLHATILHLLGLDHKRLTYRHAGRDFRLTDVSGSVVREILA